MSHIDKKMRKTLHANMTTQSKRPTQFKCFTTPREPRGIEMGPRASSAWRGVCRLCGMHKFTTNPSCGWDVNKTEVPCWEIATLSARWRTQCNSTLWALCSRWVVHKRLVALAKLSVPTTSHFLVSSPVAFKFLNVLVLNIAEKLLAGR